MVRAALDIVQKASNAYRDATGFLNYINYDAEVDEIAVMLPSKDDLMLAIMDEVITGKTVYFNASRDRVQTMPFRGSYGVEYHFLQTNGRPYRIEAMLLSGHGISHAHDALARQMLTGVYPVHASWKIGSPGEYADEENYLRAAGFWLVQDCSSSYGHFSYWMHPEGPNLYFKPRVNLRDQVTEEQA